jgi:hypothetical protein
MLRCVAAHRPCCQWFRASASAANALLARRQPASARRRAPLDLDAQGVCRRHTLGNIARHDSFVSEQIRNYGVDIGELQRAVLLHDLLDRSASIQRQNDLLRASRPVPFAVHAGRNFPGTSPLLQSESTIASKTVVMSSQWSTRPPGRRTRANSCTTAGPSGTASSTRPPEDTFAGYPRSGDD